MTQFGVNDLCKCSFGVDNVVVCNYTNNYMYLDVVNMYNCLRSKITLFVYAKLVTVVIGSQ